MNPYKVSAQFLACVMYMNSNGAKPTASEAMQFACDNWVPFLPCADDGLGRLLIRIASPSPNHRKKLRRDRAAGPNMPGAIAR
jgi:hypothetical protein